MARKPSKKPHPNKPQAKKPEPAKKPVPTTGRPSAYTEELAAEICARLAEGISLRAVCASKDMPSTSMVFRWLAAYPEFREQYARAKEESADALVEEMLAIADDGTNDFVEREIAEGKVAVVLDHEHIQRSRLRVDTRKWIASKLQPKKYGDRVQSVLTDPDGNGVVFQLQSVLSSAQPPAEVEMRPENAVIEPDGNSVSYRIESVLGKPEGKR